MTEARDAKVAHLPDAVSVKMLETTVAVLEARLAACEPYLKDGETPAQCIARNRADVDTVLGLLVAEKCKSEAAEAELTTLRAEHDQLRAEDTRKLLQLTVERYRVQALRQALDKERELVGLLIQTCSEVGPNNSVELVVHTVNGIAGLMRAALALPGEAAQEK